MSRQPTRRALILASASPRRAALLCDAGYQVTIVKPPLAEPDVLAANLTPAQYAEAISFFKAESIVGLVGRGLIVAGDTVVSLHGTIFGKGGDRDEARAILSALAGTTHDVITGLTLLDAATGRRLIRHDRTRVTMRRISQSELESYLDTGAWRGKAGAYGIQDAGDPFVERIEGSFSNVVGLPMELLEAMLRDWPGRPPCPPA